MEESVYNYNNVLLKIKISHNVSKCCNTKIRIKYYFKNQQILNLTILTQQKSLEIV